MLRPRFSKVAIQFFILIFGYQTTGEAGPEIKRHVLSGFLHVKCTSSLKSNILRKTYSCTKELNGESQLEDHALTISSTSRRKKYSSTGQSTAALWFLF